MDINKEVKQLKTMSDSIRYINEQAKKIDSLLKIVIDLQKRLLLLEKAAKSDGLRKAKK